MICNSTVCHQVCLYLKLSKVCQGIYAWTHLLSLNLIEIWHTTGIGESIPKTRSTFSNLNIKPHDETTSTTSIIETTPISLILPNSSSYNFCGYYGQSSHGCGECLFLPIFQPFVFKTSPQIRITTIMVEIPTML